MYKNTTGLTNLFKSVFDFLSSRFELSRGDGSNERSMEGLRGFAVFLVFLVHFVTLINPWIQKGSYFLLFAKSIRLVGNTGVDLFFVLSGYLIFGSLISRPQRFFLFMRRRVVRIYPAFTTVFALYVALYLFFPAEEDVQSRAAGIVYFIQNFLLLPGVFPIKPLITVAWSLSYEMFYYLAIPFFIHAFRLRSRSTVWRMFFFFFVAVLIIAFNGSYIRLVMFVSGVLLYEVMRACHIPSVPDFIGLLALCVGLSSPLIPVEGGEGLAIKFSILFFAFPILCFACFRNPSDWLARMFSWAGLRWLGNMSYSYYLIHGLALHMAFLLLSKLLPNTGYGSWFFWGMLTPMFVITLIPATALFLLIERPFSLAPRKNTPN